MRAPRHLLALLTTTALLAVPTTALGQSGAGDQQYSDPLAGTTTSASSSGSSGSSGSGATEGTQLGQAPPTTGGTSTAPTTPPAGTSATSLPNTGSDPRVLGLLGLALLLAGTGLRLRTRDGRS